MEIESSKGLGRYLELITKSSDLSLFNFNLLSLIHSSISNAQASIEWTADACPSPLRKSKDKYNRVSST